MWLEWCRSQPSVVLVREGDITIETSIDECVEGTELAAFDCDFDLDQGSKSRIDLSSDQFPLPDEPTFTFGKL